MYRRSDPRWNRTIQHITDNIEHANESAQENIYGFTQRYVNPCLASITDCLNACTAPCMPSHTDRRRHRGGRSRGRAELSFDFYDDWEEDESDGLLGWGSDNLDRFLGGASSYGATTQPGRQPTMSYGQRNRDPRYDTPRRKSTTVPRDNGQDPTIIPSSSYFGFLGRLPFNIGSKGLRYKPSAADLTEHPGTARRSQEEEQPLIEDSDEDAQRGSEHKVHRRQRSDTHTSGHTTDSLSSRGDIFPSEDELEDAVPLDDEFTISLERRTTGQWNESSTNTGNPRSGKSKRPSASRISTRTASSRNTRNSDPRSNESDHLQRSVSQTLSEGHTIEDLQREEDLLQRQQEEVIQRRRQEAQQLAVKRGLASTRLPSISPQRSPSPGERTQMAIVHQVVSPLVKSSLNEDEASAKAVPFPPFASSQQASKGRDTHNAHTAGMENTISDPRLSPSATSISKPSTEGNFVPARLPSFDPDHV